MINYTKFLKIAVGTSVAALAMEGAAVGVYNMANDWNYTRLTGQAIGQLVHDCDKSDESQIQSGLNTYTTLYQNPPARLSFTTEDEQGHMKIHLIAVKSIQLKREEDMPSPEEVKKRLNNMKETFLVNQGSSTIRLKIN
jgi:hypothetical protein